MVAEVKIHARGVPSRCLLKIGAIDKGVRCNCSEGENASTQSTYSCPSSSAGMLGWLPPLHDDSRAKSSSARKQHNTNETTQTTRSSSVAIMPCNSALSLS